MIAEVGGEYVGPTQDRVLALAKAVGVGIFPTYNEGDNVLVLNGQRSRYPATPGLSPRSRLPEAIHEVDPAQPDGRGGPGRRALEGAQGRGVGQDAAVGRGATRTSATPGARAAVRRRDRGALGRRVRASSRCSTALAYTAAAGNEKNKGDFTLLVATPGGAQESRFVGGSQRVPILVAKKLGRRSC